MTREHWDDVYRTRSAEQVSWFQPRPEPSLRALDRLGIAPSQSLVDVGGGASRLVDCLIERGFTDLCVLDIAAPALEATRRRLGPAAAGVRLEVADVTRWRPARRWELWHDRAVFHFLTDPADRAGYREALAAGLAAGGHAVLATFAPKGPERCSGLPVRRYDAAGLAAEFAGLLEPAGAWSETHTTPAGAPQAFTWCLFRRP